LRRLLARISTTPTLIKHACSSVCASKANALNSRKKNQSPEPFGTFMKTTCPICWRKFIDNGEGQIGTFPRKQFVSIRHFAFVSKIKQNPPIPNLLKLLNKALVKPCSPHYRLAFEPCPSRTMPEPTHARADPCPSRPMPEPTHALHLDATHQFDSAHDAQQQSPTLIRCHRQPQVMLMNEHSKEKSFRDMLFGRAALRLLFSLRLSERILSTLHTSAGMACMLIVRTYSLFCPTNVFRALLSLRLSERILSTLHTSVRVP
jgi:hypothetical protein